MQISSREKPKIPREMMISYMQMSIIDILSSYREDGAENNKIRQGISRNTQNSQKI
jgi:hypothetical protein